MDTLEIIRMLIENGGDYKKAYLEANPNLSIEDRKNVSRIYDNLDFIDLYGKRIAFLSIDKKKYNDLSSLGINNFEKYIRLLQEIDGIEQTSGKDYQYYKRLILGALITGFMSAVIGIFL